MRTPNHRQFGIAAGGGASLIVAGLLSIYGCNDETPMPVVAERPAEDAWEAAQPYLTEADNDMDQVVERDINVVNELFRKLQSESGIAQFADDVLSGGTKFKVLTAGDDDRTSYFAELFEKSVLSEKQLNETLQKLAMAYQSELDARDNKLLVDLQADAELSAGDGVAFPTAFTAVKQQFSEIYKSAREVAEGDLAPEAFRQGLNLIVMQQATNVASGFLANSGLADENDPTNYWLSLAAGGVIGYAVDNEVHDLTKPREELIAQIQESLSQLRDCAKKSLRDCLHEMARQHSMARRQLLAQTYGVTL